MKILSFALIALLLPAVAGADSTPANFEEAILRASADDQGVELAEGEAEKIMHRNSKAAHTALDTETQIRAIIKQDQADQLEAQIRGLIEWQEKRGDYTPQSIADCHVTVTPEEFDTCSQLLQSARRVTSATRVSVKPEKGGYSREQSDKKTIDFLR